MSQRATVNLFAGQEAIIDGVDWREPEMHDVFRELDESHGALTKKMFEDVQPEDLVLDGDALWVSGKEARRTYYFDRAPSATASLVYQAEGDELRVTLSKSRTYGLNDSGADLLARQANQRGLWVPFANMEGRRVAKIAERLASVVPIKVEVISRDLVESDGADEQKKGSRPTWLTTPQTPINADRMLADAEAAARGAYGNDYVRGRMAEYIEKYPQPEQPDPNDVFANLDMTLAIAGDISSADTEAKPTPEEYATGMQQAVDRWFDELYERLDTVRIARTVVYEGQRIRRTSPKAAATRS